MPPEEPSANWLEMGRTLIHLTPDRVGFLQDSDSKQLHKTFQLNQLDASQAVAGSRRLTAAVLRVHYLWLGRFSSFLCCHLKPLDGSLVGQVPIVCGLHDGHKGQFRAPLPPSAFPGMEAGQQYGGPDGRRGEEGLAGWSQTLWAALSCWGSALPIVQQHPPFFIHRPLCPPPPAVLPYNRLWGEALMLTCSCKCFVYTSFFSFMFYITPN